MRNQRPVVPTLTVCSISFASVWCVDLSSSKFIWVADLSKARSLTFRFLPCQLQLTSQVLEQKSLVLPFSELYFAGNLTADHIRKIFDICTKQAKSKTWTELGLEMKEKELRFETLSIGEWEGKLDETSKSWAKKPRHLLTTAVPFIELTSLWLAANITIWSPWDTSESSYWTCRFARFNGHALKARFDLDSSSRLIVLCECSVQSSRQSDQRVAAIQ